MKTYSAKPADVTRAWYVVDASEVSLGRLSTKVAQLLTGKGKPQFTRHIDCGDFVVVVNAKYLVVTGNKLLAKKYYRHSGYPGGIKQRTLEEQMSTDPTEVIIHAVRGMIPDNKLRPARLARLKVYTEADHEHQAQKPTAISLKESK